MRSTLKNPHGRPRWVALVSFCSHGSRTRVNGKFLVGNALVLLSRGSHKTVKGRKRDIPRGECPHFALVTASYGLIQKGMRPPHYKLKSRR